MDQFGLTEREKNTNLHNYNHALFRNMMFFMDSVWEINMLTRTVAVLEDRNDPDKSNREFEFDAMFREYEETYIVSRERETFRKYMSFENLERLEEEVSFGLHLRKGGSGPELYNIVLTPAFDETRTLYCVYLSSRNLQSEVRRELEEYHRQEQFLHALLSNAYFHFSFDLSGDCMINEDYVTKDGRHLIRDLTQSELPVSFDCFVRKWFEVCRPDFEKEDGKQIFTEQYLKQAYWNKQHLLELEVRQNDLGGSGTPVIMQVFIVLMERPRDKHIHAHVIWMNTGRFQKETIRDNMELRSSNEDLKKTLSQEQQYRLASVSGALLVYNINLTRNLIEE